MGAPRLGSNFTENDLIRFIGERVQQITGVQLGERQTALVQGRLAKRVRELGLEDLLSYGKHYFENEDVETNVLVSLLTTHHTYFFREFSHFEFLLSKTLPRLVASRRARGQKVIRIWSAACSRGQEVYSLSMFLRQHLAQIAPDFRFEILGSDVCQESVAIARNGVYPWAELKTVPANYMRGNWARGTGEIADFVKAKKEIREPCQFEVINLLELHKTLGSRAFDVIFCRNVFIYFTPAQVEGITRDFLKHLEPDGEIFIGLSESLKGMSVPVHWVGPSIYSPAEPKNESVVVPLKAAAPERAAAKAASSEPSAPAPQALPATLRVLCVDDSPTVVTLLKKMLVKEHGFEIVGTAGNGLEAAEMVKTLKPDLMTLDIHMPKMDGVAYLQAHFKKGHPPVVIVSSISREESSTALKCLDLGASDYVEKPSLDTLTERADEIRAKLKAAFATRLQPARDTALERSFQRSPLISESQKKMRVILAGLAERDAVLEILKELKAPQPATVVCFDGGREVLSDIARQWSGRLKAAPAYKERLTAADLGVIGAVYLVPMEAFRDLEGATGERPTSLLVVGVPGAAIQQKAAALRSAQLIIEDRGSATPTELRKLAQQVVPLTSFAYESDRFLSRAEVKK